MDTAFRHRLLLLGAAYVTLIGLGFLAFSTAHVHVGALAVIPILFISYYLRPPAAIVTAFCTGVALGLLDQTKGAAPDHLFDVPPIADALILSLSLCTVVIVANRLRETSLANDLLRGSLVNARRAAERDPLTGIGNRAYFMHALNGAVETATPERRVAVLFCDLDRFKAINDTYGHIAGDSVLRLAAARLVNTVRAFDIVARLGGDEFVVLVRNVHDPREVAHMVANIEHAFADPFHSDSHQYSIGITVGVSVCPDDARDVQALLRTADARMYRSKELKRAQQVST